jgi:hypothetical protein
VPADPGFGLEAGDELRLRVVRGVNCKVRQIQEEGARRVAPDEVLRSGGQKIRQVLSRRVLGLRIGLEIEVRAHADDVGTRRCNRSGLRRR